MSNYDLYFDLKNGKRYFDKNSEIYALEEKFIRLFETHQNDIAKLEAKLDQLETKQIQMKFEKFKEKQIAAYEQALLQKMSAKKQEFLDEYKKELIAEIKLLREKLGC